MRYRVCVYLLLQFCIFLDVEAQDSLPGGCRMMFYNVENLFDPFHDTLKNDYEFVAGSINGWNWKKFEKKLNDISKVIIHAGGWQPPELIAFSEVENRFVLNQLLKRTPLERFGYRVIHEESPDERGIDVAMIYRPEYFREISHRSIIINLPDSIHTRSILYVNGILLKDESLVHESDTLHMFINHWPSRTGGPSVTEHRRKAAAMTLKKVTDSIQFSNPAACIILTGDFNDEPTDNSINKVLGANIATSDATGRLTNLMAPLQGGRVKGTNKYRDQWGLIDQFIVSTPMVRKDSNSSIKVSDARILDFSFLLMEDEKFGGMVPFRTFNGMQYQGGFSDHLPVMVTINF